MLDCWEARRIPVAVAAVVAKLQGVDMPATASIAPQLGSARPSRRPVHQAHQRALSALGLERLWAGVFGAAPRMQQPVEQPHQGREGYVLVYGPCVASAVFDQGLAAGSAPITPVVGGMALSGPSSERGPDWGACRTFTQPCNASAPAAWLAARPECCIPLVCMQLSGGVAQCSKDPLQAGMQQEDAGLATSSSTGAGMGARGFQSGPLVANTNAVHRVRHKARVKRHPMLHPRKQMVGP